MYKNGRTMEQIIFSKSNMGVRKCRRDMTQKSAPDAAHHAGASSGVRGATSKPAKRRSAHNCTPVN